MTKLAVIIPAFKKKYFKNALISLAQQTCKNFKVYIGDDFSTDDLKSVVQEFENVLEIKYVRFNYNLGSENLVQQWARCVEITEGEDWLWLFSDDDVAEPDCVGAFFDALAKTKEKYDAYRFDVIKIDDEGSVIMVLPESPKFENSYELAYHILIDKRGVGIVDHIYRRAKYLENNGYINFHYAQGSDWATAIRFSNPKGVYTIKGPKVKWRYSHENISGTAYKVRRTAIFGHLQFLEWITEEFKFSVNLNSNTNGKITHYLLERNLWKTLKYHYRGVPLFSICQVAMRINSIFNWGFLKSLKYCMKVNYSVFKYKRFQLKKI